jgi:hypothetical protein
MPPASACSAVTKGGIFPRVKDADWLRTERAPGFGEGDGGVRLSGAAPSTAWE